MANFLKEIMRELTEPVVPFENYPAFRDLPKSLKPEDKVEYIVRELRSLPELNRSTLLYLARFFTEVATHSVDNLMNQYNLAVIITPNLFRSRELTQKDLLNHGTLTDVFTLIMHNIDSITAKIQAIEADPTTLTNRVLTSQNQLLDGSNRANNRITVSQGFSTQTS